MPSFIYSILVVVWFYTFFFYKDFNAHMTIFLGTDYIMTIALTLLLFFTLKMYTLLNNKEEKNENE